MNKQSNRKSTWALCLSIAAIVLCLLVFALWTFETLPHSVILPESFIGACVTLLGVIVTVAVGWQIYNAIEMRQMIRQIEEKQASLDESQRKLDAKLDEQTKHTALIQHISIAEMRERDGKYAEAVYYYLGALYNAIDIQEQPDNKDLIFRRMPDCLGKLKSITEIPADMYKDIENIDATVRASKHFNMFQKQYDEWLQEYMSKITKKR